MPYFLDKTVVWMGLRTFGGYDGNVKHTCFLVDFRHRAAEMPYFLDKIVVWMGLETFWGLRASGMSNIRVFSSILAMGIQK